MKHFSVRLSEEEYTIAKNIGLWELEQEITPIVKEIIASKEHKYGNNNKQY